jgi:hypothetical protein
MKTTFKYYLHEHLSTGSGKFTCVDDKWWLLRVGCVVCLTRRQNEWSKVSYSALFVDKYNILCNQNIMKFSLFSEDWRQITRAESPHPLYSVFNISSPGCLANLDGASPAWWPPPLPGKAKSEINYRKASIIRPIYLMPRSFTKRIDHH